jgi:phage terminase large subunit-like protein
MPYRRNPGQQRIRKLLTDGKRYCLVYGGSRSGKTFEVLGTVAERALLAPGSKHLVVRQEATAARRALVKGTWPEMIAARFPDARTKFNGEYGYFEMPNGSSVWVGGLNDEKAMERILGNEYSTIYVNEASEITYGAMLLLRTRLAAMATTIKGEPLSQRMYVDLNPTVRQHWTYQLWMANTDPVERTSIDGSQYGAVMVNPEDNAENLSDEYLADLRSLPPAQRRRFYDGQYGADMPDALWRREIIRRVDRAPDLARIVVAVDPAVSNAPGSDETGIVVAGVDSAGVAYVLDDLSGKYDPIHWARAAVSAFDIHNADLVIGETNQGGDLVENNLRTVRANIPFKAVTATRGKIVRAEPMASLYERGKVMHVGEFPALEDQMCSFRTDTDRKKQGFSPDRVDALVWALTNLFPDIGEGPALDFDPMPAISQNQAIFF